MTRKGEILHVPLGYSKKKEARLRLASFSAIQISGVRYLAMSRPASFRLSPSTEPFTVT